MKIFSIISIALSAASVAASSTVKVVRKKRGVEKQRRSLSLSDLLSKQKQAIAIAKTAVTVKDYVPPSSRSDSFKCFLDTITNYDSYEVLIDWNTSYYEEMQCDEELNCDLSTAEMEAGCEEAGGVVDRVTMTFCPDEPYYPFISTWLNYPVCVSPLCGGESFKDIFLEYYAPLAYNVGLGEEEPFSYYGTYEEYLSVMGFGTCDATLSSAEAPKSSKAPSSKAPKSSKAPSSKAPKSSKAPSSKAPSSKAPKSSKAPSSKAPSSKSPKSTKSPGIIAGATSSSGSTMQTTVAATVGTALALLAL